MDPWVINNDKFASVLQVIWDAVYQEKIEHTISVSGPVYSLISVSLFSLIQLVVH